MDADDFLDELGLGTGEEAVVAQQQEQPSVCTDTTRDAAAPTRLDITGSVSVRSGSCVLTEEAKKRKAGAGGAPTSNGGKKQRRAKQSTEEKVSRSRMSATDEAYRDTARSTIPAPARERMLTAESTSFVTADPTRGEEKRTLSSVATAPGVPLSDADLISKGKEVPRRSRRGKRRGESGGGEEAGGRRKKRAKRAAPEPVVHRVADIPPEAVAEVGGMREAREIEKHPGKVKTAALGVAVPHPGDRESQLRITLDASALTRRDAPREDAPLKEVPAGDWETDTVEEIARGLDERRMGVGPRSEASTAVQAGSQLKTVFANQNRVTLDQLREGISRFFDGVLEQKLLGVQVASKAMRENSAPRDPARSLRVPNTASPAGNGGGSRRGQKTLILDDSEEAIRGLFERSVPSVPALSPFAAGAKDQVLCLPRLGLGSAVDMPLDEAELAVLRGGSTIREAMVYFMSFDDSVAAMSSAYKTACEMASMVTTADALNPQNQNGDAVRRALLKKLREREQELDRQWEAGGARDSALWTQRFATRVLGAILSGELRDQRHNLVRTLVAKEEGLMGLYREPAQRCFLGEGSAGADDTDVIARIRRLAQEVGATGSGSEVPATVLPKLGTPASKAYCADFLRAPDPENSLERPCARGERNCVAWLAASQPSWPSTGALNRGARAFVMREFHAPDAWQAILESKTLPPHRGNCLMCSRHTTMFMYMQVRLIDTFSVIGVKDALRDRTWCGLLLGQSHSNEIDDEGGYTQSDMLPVCQPTDGPWTGVVAPIVKFRANSYVLGESTTPINIHQKSGAAAASDAASAKTLPCFFERTAADFH